MHVYTVGVLTVGNIVLKFFWPLFFWLLTISVLCTDNAFAVFALLSKMFKNTWYPTLVES